MIRSYVFSVLLCISQETHKEMNWSKCVDAMNDVLRRKKWNIYP